MNHRFLTISVSLILTHQHSQFGASAFTNTATGRLLLRRATAVRAVHVTSLPEFNSKKDYEDFVKAPQVSTLPKGFSCGSAVGTFVSVEAPAMGNLPIKATVISLDQPTDSWAACFTKNKFPGAPVIIGRSRLNADGPLQALVINNKVSNVCAGGDGVADSEQICAAVASALKLPMGPTSVLPSSTGVIGWRLPAKELSVDIVPKAIEAMQTLSAFPAAQAIMTTDRWPKIRSCVLPNSGARIVGIAKGAGMIEPNMATMLSYIFTDAIIPKDYLRKCLSEIVDESYNSISVDGDESTSDTVVCLASNKVALSSQEEWKDALTQICKGLAADIVRNGEGTGHVMRVTVSNYPGPNKDARRLGRRIVNSPLFKCAVKGNDPNTGRLAAAIGSFIGRESNGDDISLSDMALTLGGRTIFSKGKFILEGDAVEKELSNHMKDAEFNEHEEFPRHQRFVDIGVDFGVAPGNTNKGSAVVFGSDLTNEYIAVNADYRS
eukprot:CAMPEP_0172417624 /NCGR_PEP_ID=MMETSP1064-20121228/4162_1 /TAXON_ID=202472 /ORGANISM="Aulacoseira subarctica , Strain CCAP 1002/5" /LENGTH=492 /DNA_ID=CAMNT_0013156097 /DNA_START=99 /DNA_END=1577 /DNA_ORIENTATION=+